MFEAEDARKQLEVDKLPLIPKDVLEEEFRARKQFLASLNVSTGFKALLLQLEAQSLQVASLSAALKLSLPPLWTAFMAFTQRRIELRQKALLGCDTISQQVRCLLQSFPFSQNVFGDEEVAALKEASLRQAKPISWLLSFSAPAKKSAGPA